MSGRLTELLAAIDRPCALAFVDQQIGLLLAYDNEHDSDLTDQLERALDELASQPLDRPTTPARTPAWRDARPRAAERRPQPSDRLALHLALKLHRMQTAAGGHPRRGVADH